jgi:hypothetical protein
MKKILTLGLLFLTIAVNAQKSDALKWISGAWILKTNRGDMVEKWIAINDSTFQGKSMMVKTPGDSTLQETIELKYRNKAWTYMPIALGQNNNQPVTFNIIFLSRDEFIAQNLNHDFPQRIAYRRVKNQLFASIEGSRNSKYSKINFDFMAAGK